METKNSNLKLIWPWTNDSFDVVTQHNYPKISIITPSYNQGKFIEQTIRSVLLQKYPNLEYIIMDGNSIDNTVEIIKKYDRWITYWESVSDKGQTHAINKGLKRSNGDIVAFINSDDYYAPNTFFQVAELYKKNHEWIVGAVNYIDENNLNILRWAPNLDTSSNNFLDWLAGAGGIPQPSTFWSRKILNQYGYFLEEMHFSFDDEYWIRLLSKNEKITFVDMDFSFRRFHKKAKTSTNPQEFIDERTNFIISKYQKNLTASQKRYIEITKTKSTCRTHIKRSIDYFFNKMNIDKGFIHLSAAIKISPKYTFISLGKLAVDFISKKVK